MPTKRPTASPLIIKVVTQRTEADCTVACLAMVTGCSYEECLVAVAAEAPTVLREGAYMGPLQRAAGRLGYRLRQRRKNIDIDEDSGLLQVDNPHWRYNHIVVLRAGLIIDTDGSIYDADVYLHANKAQATLLLMPEPLDANA